MSDEKKDKPTPEEKKDQVRKSIEERPDFYEIDPNQPLPPSGDPRAPGKTH